MDSLPIIDLELGLNDVKHQELEQNLKKKQNKYINIDFNFNSLNIGDFFARSSLPPSIIMTMRFFFKL